MDIKDKGPEHIKTMLFCGRHDIPLKSPELPPITGENKKPIDVAIIGNGPSHESKVAAEIATRLKFSGFNVITPDNIKDTVNAIDRSSIQNCQTLILDSIAAKLPKHKINIDTVEITNPVSINKMNKKTFVRDERFVLINDINRLTSGNIVKITHKETLLIHYTEILRTFVINGGSFIGIKDGCNHIFIFDEWHIEKII